MRIHYSPSLSSLTTLHTGGKALARIILDSSEDCLLLPQLIKKIGGTPFIIGGGSNILFGDGELPIIIISNNLDNKKMPVIDDEQIINGVSYQNITLNSSLSIPRFLAFCMEKGLSGLEGLVGIPGQIGGAVSMNAGAFQSSTNTCLTELTIYSPETEIITINNDSWKYDYRFFSLNFPVSFFIILSAKFSLLKTQKQLVRANMEKNLNLKKSSQPITQWTAGCIFKNPEHDSAGRLLELCGMKTLRKGNFFFSPLHANFLVHDNLGTCETKSEDAFFLIKTAKEQVSRQFGVQLETEVKIII